MKKESIRQASPVVKKIINTFVFPALLLFTGFVSNSYADVNFGDGLTNKIIPNCSLRKEYNYFLNQWTTNQVCDPQVVNVPQSSSNYYRSQNQHSTVNYYSAPAPVQNSYVAPVNNYSGYYTNNTGINYGTSANYLLSSFGTGGYYDSGYYYTNPGYYANNSYYGGYSIPNSVYYYTPSISTSKSYYADDYYDRDSFYEDRGYLNGYDEYGKIGTESHAFNYAYDVSSSGYTSNPNVIMDMYNEDYGTDY